MRTENQEALAIKERLGQYQSLIFKGFTDINTSQRLGGSGYKELSILLSSSLSEIVSKETSEAFGKMDSERAKHQKEYTNYILYFHARKGLDEEKPDDWKFWSNKHISGKITDEMSNFTFSKVQRIKKMLLEDLQKAGLLLTNDKPQTKSSVI